LVGTRKWLGFAAFTAFSVLGAWGSVLAVFFQTAPAPVA
jgi:hypothetical protein